MSRRIDWKWVALGVVIMFGLSFVASLIVASFWGEELRSIAEGVQSGEGAPAGESALGTVPALLIAVISFLSFAIGGYIVGVKSAGRTILEPGISAAIAVALGLVLAGGFNIGNLLAGALVPFIAGLLGGWLGERRHKPARIHHP